MRGWVIATSDLGMPCAVDIKFDCNKIAAGIVLLEPA